MDLNILSDMMRKAVILDLSWSCFEGMPGCATHAKYHLCPWETKDMGYVSNNFMISMGEHNGTHIDSTFHFYNRDEGGRSIDEFPAEKFCGPCATIQVQGLQDTDMISVEQIRQWEMEHGKIRKDDIVLFCTGWGKYFKKFPEGRRYVDGFPGLSPEAAQYLAGREVKLVGIDTLAADPSFSITHDAHRTLLPREILIIECLANLEKMPPRAWFFGFPLKLEGASGAPVRAVGIF